MATTEKKPNGGYSRLKVKYAKLKAEKEELEAKIAELESKAKAAAEAHSKEIGEKEETIRKQGTKISNLTADLRVAQGNEEEWKRKYNEALAHVPAWRKWLHNL